MKKLFSLLIVALMALCLVGCSSSGTKEETSIEEEVVETPTNVENVVVSGLYEEKHDENEDDYYLMSLKDDGTGDLTNMMTGVVIPLTYDVNGKDILAHVGSTEDESPITYVNENTLSYNEINYNKIDSSLANVVGIWKSEANANGEYVKLTFKSDGSGSTMNMPFEIGLAFRYEVDGTNILTHMGSVDDETPMTYVSENNTILYDDVPYTRVVSE